MMRDEEWLLKEKYDGELGAPGFAADCARLEAGEPLAYVIGWQPFLGLQIWLDSKPLIPRPETEYWVEKLLEKVERSESEYAETSAAERSRESASGWPPEDTGGAGMVGRSDGRRAERGRARRHAEALTRFPHALIREAPIRFLDLCAGSGAIGCVALAWLPNARVYFGELDPAHETTIRKNIRENGLDGSRADVRIGDLFAPFGALTFDVIAANPPYIPAGRALDASVAEHEPHAALFAVNDGLALIRRIASELPHRLNPGGVAYVECDSAHAERARALFAASGMRAQIMHDQYDVPRVIVVRRERNENA